MIDSTSKKSSSFVELLKIACLEVTAEAVTENDPADRQFVLINEEIGLFCLEGFENEVQ